MKSSFMRITILLLGLILIFEESIAQKFTPFGVDSSMFHNRGSVHYSSTLEHYFSEELNPSFIHKPISVTQFGAQIDYYILNRIALGGSAQLTIPRGERVVDGKGISANTVGTSFMGSLRVEVLNLTHHNFYIETQQGMIFTLDPFPPEGTSWNFLVKYGLGYCVKFSGTKFLCFGWRWAHISNGMGLVSNNPAYDGNGFYIAFKFVR